MMEAASETSGRPYVWENGQGWKQYSWNDIIEWSWLMKQHRHTDSAMQLQRLGLNTSARKLVLVLEMADNWQYVRKAPFWLEYKDVNDIWFKKGHSYQTKALWNICTLSTWIFLWRAHTNFKKLHLFVSHLFMCLANMIIVTGRKVWK